MQARFLYKKQRIAVEHWAIFILVWASPSRAQVVWAWNFRYTATGRRAIRHVSPIETYRKWRRQPAVGCMFARLIAIKPDRYSQVIECLPRASTPARMAELVANRVEALVVDKSVAAAALLFPEISSIEEMTRVMLALNEYADWSVKPFPLDNEVVGKMVGLRVVREIPFGKKSCPSEALVLGNFASFPPTRRSPIAALEIFVGEPMPTDPKSGKPTAQANLAHIEAKAVLGDGPFDDVWKKSEDGRLASLGSKPDNRAKAKVAMTISPSLARRLGCEP